MDHRQTVLGYCLKRPLRRIGNQDKVHGLASSNGWIDWFSSSTDEDIGEFEGNVYRGKYVYWQESEQVQHNITVTFSLSNDGLLTAEFVGDGPLDGLVLQQLQKI